MDLVSREKELALLSAALDRAQAGSFQIVFVTGEPGAGKTALVETFIEHARKQYPDLLTGEGKCFEISGAGQEPYSPFLSLLDGIYTSPSVNAGWILLTRAMADLAPDWLQILPAGNVAAAVIRSIQWGQREFGDKGEGIDKQRHMVQFANILRLASKDHPVLLWVDDLQWSDNASLDLISFLADQISTEHILLICAFRPTDVASPTPFGPHPVRKLVSQLKQHARCSEIKLSNFTLANTEQYLELREHHLPRAFIKRLWRESGGNPLFIREYLALLHAKHLTQREKGYFILAQPEVEVEIPPSVEAVIHQRLDLIAQDLKHLLSYASVQGERFTSHVLTGSLGTTAELPVLDALDRLESDYKLISELEDKQLVVKFGAGYKFVHALIQQVLYKELSGSQRRLLHLTIARLLEQLYSTEAPAYATELAHHYELGGDIPRALDYYHQAVQNALAVQSLDDAGEAIASIQRLAELIRDRLWLARALLLQAETLFWKGAYSSAVDTTREGERLCEELRQPVMHAYFHYWQARSLRCLGRISESVETAKLALELLTGQPDTARLAGLLHAYLGSVSDSLSLDDQRQHLLTALEIADQHGLPDVRARALIEQAWIAINRLDQPQQAVKFAQQAARDAREHNLLNEQVSCLRLEAFGYLRLDQGHEAFSKDEEAVALARQHGLPVALHLALYSQSFSAACGLGDLQRALQALSESIAIAGQYHFPVSRNLWGQWFNLNFSLGRWDEARRGRDNLYASLGSSYQRGLGYDYCLQGHLAFGQGQLEQAIEFYRKSIAMYNRYSPDERDTRSVEPYLGAALVKMGHCDSAREIVQRALTYWDGRYPARHANCLRILADIDLSAGKTEEAIRQLHAAESAAAGAAAEYPWPVQPQIQTSLARACIAAGRGGDAIQSALAAYQSYSATGHFLRGEAAYLAGQAYATDGKPELAIGYFNEARDTLEKLGLSDPEKAG
ncbi:protein containg AAA ATPase domain [Longilinea arvoryzae]|uniref:Protein containg AAA ATPase domain n=1 Tax=Longilinea arvoryzae TaxID=360412 RepID=A0A0K8MY77_9CHLR|nr:AAA family ATPase [Longilinea arvoryzae]GAP15981.1 protein containg AAA ATPase domain [Longilinea arvoryzae]